MHPCRELVLRIVVEELLSLSSLIVICGQIPGIQWQRGMLIPSSMSLEGVMALRSELLSIKKMDYWEKLGNCRSRNDCRSREGLKKKERQRNLKNVMPGLSALKVKNPNGGQLKMIRIEA